MLPPLPLKLLSFPGLFKATRAVVLAPGVVSTAAESRQPVMILWRTFKAELWSVGSYQLLAGA